MNKYKESKYRIVERPVQSIYNSGWEMEFIPQYLTENGTWEYIYNAWVTTTEWLFFKKSVGTSCYMFKTLQEAINFLDRRTGKIKLEPTIKVHEYPSQN